MQETVTVVRDFLDAINQWDFDGMEARLHPDRFLYTLPYRPAWLPGELRGRDAYIEFARSWSKAIDGTENLDNVRVSALADDPNTVIARYTNDFRLAESGFHYQNDLVCIFELSDGLITSFDERLDAVPLILATGGTLSPPEAG